IRRMSGTPQKKKSNLPPKRGQIKAQIFSSLVDSVSSTISKTGESILNVFGKSGGDSGSASASSASTPTPSGYNSETNNSDVS
ncbi:hypothetical protein LR48_Vigan05g183900, partial [Vigna angularis]